MNVRADVDKKFIRRFLFIAIGCFGLMIWALYDATLVYPVEVERAVAYKKLSDQLKSGEITEAEKDENWKAIVKENNWGAGQTQVAGNGRAGYLFSMVVVCDRCRTGAVLSDQILAFAEFLDGGRRQIGDDQLGGIDAVGQHHSHRQAQMGEERNRQG